MQSVRRFRGTMLGSNCNLRSLISSFNKVTCKLQGSGISPLLSLLHGMHIVRRVRRANCQRHIEAFLCNVAKSTKRVHTHAHYVGLPPPTMKLRLSTITAGWGWGRVGLYNNPPCAEREGMWKVSFYGIKGFVELHGMPAHAHPRQTSSRGSRLTSSP